MSCPDTGLRDFPIQIGNGVTGLEDINKSIEEDLLIYVSWGPRSNAPKFKRNSPLLDEGVEGPSTSSSTLRYNNLDYTLKTVQITKPQHATFVVGAQATAVKAEAILIFSNTGALGDSYIFLCIPIIEAAASSGSTYIEAILADRLNNRQLTLDSLVPTKRNCVTYATCLVKTDRATNRSVAINANVFVFPFGLQETQNRINLLRVASQGRASTDFGSLVLPDNIQARTQTNLYTIDTAADYRNFLRYRVFPPAGRESTAQSSNLRTDSTNAYQCVPLKPAENVRDGKIVIDTDKGVPLSQVLEEQKADDEKPEGLTPGDVERIIAVTFGTALGLFILSILAYTISVLTSKNAGPAFSTVRDTFKDMLPTTFIAIVVGIIGFLIGFFAQRM